MNRRIFYLIVAVILVVYLFSAKGYLEVSDTGYSVKTAISLYTQGSFRIQDDTHDSFVGPDGAQYSKYGLGLPLSYLPYVAASSGLSRLTHLPFDEVLAFLISFSNIPFAIATLLLFAQLLRKLDISESTVCFATIALGLGTLCWRYAVYDFSEEVQMALLMLAVYGVVRPQKRDLIWAGVGFGGLLIFKLVHILLLPFFGVYLLLTFRGPSLVKAVLHFGLPVLLSIGFIACMNELRFGNPFESGYGVVAHAFVFSQIPYTLPALLFSFDKGIFVFCPVLILGIAGWRSFFQAHFYEALLCLSVILVNLVWAAAWHWWMGGWSWGPRLLISSLPLWLLPAVFFIDASIRERKFLVAMTGLLVISIICQVPGILVKDQEIHTIKQNLCTPEEASSMPSDSAMAWILLWHKLFHPEEVYGTSDFIHSEHPDEKTFDLTSYHTFQGMNVWTEQLSRQLKKPVIRCLPALGLLLLIGLSIAGIRAPCASRPRS